MKESVSVGLRQALIFVVRELSFIEQVEGMMAFLHVINKFMLAPYT